MASSRFSPQFIEACLQKDLSPGDPMPCPRCGSDDVNYKTSKSWRRVALILVPVAAVLLLVRQLLAGAVAGGLAVMTLLISVMDEPRYVCGHCDHSWRLEDARKWAKAIRHDLERRV